jgi:hypothetical protein
MAKLGAHKGEHRSVKSEIKKNEHLSEDTEFPKGHTPWNKGIKYTLKRKIKDYVLPYLSQWQWGYLAGIIDGEGCISYRIKHSEGKKEPYCTIVLGIGQKDDVLLKEIYKWLGLEYGLTYSPKDNMWNLQVTTKRANLEILKGVEKYLIYKKQKAQEAINWLENDMKKYTKSGIKYHAKRFATAGG